MEYRWAALARSTPRGAADEFGRLTIKNNGILGGETILAGLASLDSLDVLSGAHLRLTEELSVPRVKVVDAVIAKRVAVEGCPTIPIAE